MDADTHGGILRLQVKLLHPELCAGVAQHIVCDPDRVKVGLEVVVVVVSNP